ncbi:MAG: DoxX family protein [Bacteroidetes bacterium]|nr:DoxX family protein [Bacteroidota bacterium]
MIKNLLRIVVATIFIISGFVKAVDTVGFSFKLEEYFSPTVFNIPFLEKIALPIASVVVAFELVLGLMLLLKIKIKQSLVLLIALCVFFAFLTFYSAWFNKVTDCGCFGDAIKFTPWQSFWKDIALLLGLIILWFSYKKEFKSPSPISSIQKITFGISSLIFGFVMNKGMTSEPIIDFRDYKIGTNLQLEKKKIAENPAEYKSFYTMKNTKTGEEKLVSQDDFVNQEEYWKEGTPWQIVEGKEHSELVKEGYKSEIVKFNIEDTQGNNPTETIIKAPSAVLIFSYAPEKADTALVTALENKVKSLKNTVVWGVSSNPNLFKTIPGGIMDATAIKTIARSNPFVLVLKNGIIVDKLPAKEYLTK